MARHRRLLVPWWRRNPANAAIAATAVLAAGTATTSATLHMTPRAHETFVDPDPTEPLRFGPTVAPVSLAHEETRYSDYPDATSTSPLPVTPTDPPTDPITRPTVVLSVVTTGPLPTTPAHTLSYGEKLVYLASLQAGKPYVYGAAGPSAFDCSGLVQYVYGQMGRGVPRTTQAQFNASQHVEPDEKQIGDLIFFGTPANIYHVGIYAGNNQMWVARHAGEPVQLETIWTSHYYVGTI